MGLKAARGVILEAGLLPVPGSADQAMDKRGRMSEKGSCHCRRSPRYLPHCLHPVRPSKPVGSPPDSPTRGMRPAAALRSAMSSVSTWLQALGLGRSWSDLFHTCICFTSCTRRILSRSFQKKARKAPLASKLGRYRFSTLNVVCSPVPVESRTRYCPLAPGTSTTMVPVLV